MSNQSKRQKRDKQGRRIRSLPEGAVAADLSKQAPNNSYSPKEFYVDEPFTCQGCGRREVWTASQQKWYFEVAKGSIYGRASLCRPCRQKRRRAKEAQGLRSVRERK
jgi:hypothetical protein